MWDWCLGMRIKYWRTSGQLKIISSVGLRFGPLFNLPPELFIQIQFTSLSFFPFRFPFPRHSFQGPYNHPSLCFPASSLGGPVLQPPLCYKVLKDTPALRVPHFDIDNLDQLLAILSLFERAR